MALFLGRPLDYRACGQDELRRFVKDRTKEDIAKNIGKEQLVAKLEALDQAATFPFEKLPSEIRLEVYQDLVFHPQILCASKLIYEEAKPVLDKQESVTRLVVERGYAGDAIRVDDGSLIWSSDMRCRFSTMASRLAKWPQKLLSARHIRIDFEVLPRTYWVLYQLASIIGNVSVEICIRTPDIIVDRWDIPPFLWPLARMGPRAEVSLQGVCDRVLEDNIRRDFAANRSTRTLLYQCLQVIDELEDTLKLAKQADIPAFFIYSLCQMARQVEPSCSHFAAEEKSMNNSLEKLRYTMDQNPEYARLEKPWKGTEAGIEPPGVLPISGPYCLLPPHPGVASLFWSSESFLWLAANPVLATERNTAIPRTRLAETVRAEQSPFLLLLL
ncbi:hypothetical protein CBER1_07577 [Cercospora berteroae]|uniref:F-box domain-containing protein n=1 Tax=Cercospora berteroae TaxID=357750 RepID=A0A2S6CK08_9PEZI|nr:hypothetical protein CBER1_07577 [Cercospora berteroae]